VLGAEAGQPSSGPEGQSSLAGASLLALGGVLLGLSAALGLRRPARP
jgi:hypothetical protein